MIDARQKARLRRRILQLADASKAAGGVPGRMMQSLIEDRTNRALDDSDLLGLIQDVENMELVELIDTRSQLPCEAHVGLDNLVVRITGNGTALLAQAIAPNPLVEDPRNA